MTKKARTIRQQAEEHWNFVESTLATARLMERKLFMDAFAHGYKHGVEKKRRK